MDYKPAYRAERHDAFLPEQLRLLVDIVHCSGAVLRLSE